MDEAPHVNNLEHSRPAQLALPSTRATERATLSRSLDNDLSHITWKLESLRQQESRLLNSRARLLAFPLGDVAPIRQLSDALLAEIFLCCNPYGTDAHPNNGPLSFTHVNSRWRRVALSTPQLWTTLYLDEYNSVSPRDPFFFVTNWLSRAGNEPLEIHIREELFQKCREQLMAYLFSLSKQWRVITLHLLPEACSFPTTGMPWLESITLQAEAQLESRIIADIQRALGPDKAPKLRDITWKDKIQVPYTQLCFYWPQLEYLRIEIPLSISQCFVIFSILTLQSADFTNVCFPLSLVESTFVHRIFHPALSSLCITGTIDVIPIFTTLTCPSLRYITLDFRNGYLPPLSFQDSLCRMLRRSYCPLQSLSIGQVYIDEAHLHDCLIFISRTVTEINIAVPRDNPPLFTDAIIKSLTLPGPEYPRIRGKADDVVLSYPIGLCPQLQSIQLSPDSIACGEQTFLDMAKSRWDNGPGHAILKYIVLPRDSTIIPLLCPYTTEGPGVAKRVFKDPNNYTFLTKRSSDDHL
ncbi:hypothetical protein AX15_002701 [Amanita polypyramis BW_CC]|nr:hypothetical protein AX15_002701 [Amanita polypyramis BW_CC]